MGDPAARQSHVTAVARSSGLLARPRVDRAGPGAVEEAPEPVRGLPAGEHDARSERVVGEPADHDMGPGPVDGGPGHMEAAHVHERSDLMEGLGPDLSGQRGIAPERRPADQARCRHPGQGRSGALVGEAVGDGHRGFVQMAPEELDPVRAGHRLAGAEPGGRDAPGDALVGGPLHRLPVGRVGRDVGERMVRPRWRAPQAPQPGVPVGAGGLPARAEPTVVAVPG